MVRKLLPLLAVATVAATSSPAPATGQISSCWLCEDSPFQPGNGSEICVGWYWGRAHCAQAGTPDFHLCLPCGGFCWDDVFAAADEMAIESVRAGQMLRMDGDHLVLTEGDDIVVMRKCGAEIARFAMSELKGADDQAGLLAIGPTERLQHPERHIPATDRRRGILEE